MNVTKLIHKQKHLNFSKERASEILKNGGTPLGAWTSFLSDIRIQKSSLST